MKPDAIHLLICDNCGQHKVVPGLSISLVGTPCPMCRTNMLTWLEYVLALVGRIRIQLGRITHPGQDADLGPGGRLIWLPKDE